MPRTKTRKSKFFAGFHSFIFLERLLYDKVYTFISIVYKASLIELKLLENFVNWTALSPQAQARTQPEPAKKLENKGPARPKPVIKSPQS